MSRPPRPFPASDVSGGLPVRDGQLQVFAPTFQQLLDTELALSLAELGRLPPSGDGDFARSLFDLSAVVAHVLGSYQNFYGGEAFLGTARTQQSLVRHGRRLGYTSDPGVAATGVVSFRIKAGLSGVLAAGLPLLSVPKGEQTSQDYETLDDRRVDARWNAIELTDRSQRVQPIPAGSTALELAGTGFGLAAGDSVLLVRLSSGVQDPSFDAPLLTLTAVTEDATRGTTKLELTPGLPQTIGDTSALEQFRLLAQPALDLRLFGWDADARLFPPDALQNAGQFVSGVATDPLETLTTGSTTVATFKPNFGYEFTGEKDIPYSDDVLYLHDALKAPILGTWVVRLQGGVATPLFVTQQTAASVAFVREQRQDTIIKLPEDPNTENAPTPLSTTTFIPQWISASTTRLQVRTAQAASPLPRTASDIRSRWLAGWQLELLLQVVEPNPVALGNEAILDGDLTGLEPGMLVVLATHDGGSAQLVELTSVTVTSATAISAATTTIAFRGRGPAPASGFQKSDLVVLANVIRISHGKTVREVLGDSDGVTPFLRFTLKKSPVTHLPEALGAVPALEVRVDNVLWTRVVDFSQSGPEDRHYLVQRDEAQALSVLFGDGQTGAVPPAGQRHVRAVYRVGTGRIGNVEAGRTSRLQKAHPLVLSALNPLPISGGTEPAAVDQVRTEATRFIRTFDRAVSATDYADLALLFPGIARAKATSDPATGVALVVADADGNALGDSGPFRSFLDTRRDRGVPLRLVAPEPVDVVLAVNVEFDGAFFDFEVAKSVRDAIASSSESAPGLFAFRGRELGQPAFLSEVYRALHAVPGVVFSQITVFDLAPPKQLAPSPKLFRARLPFARRQLAVQDAIQIAAQQWLRVTLDNLSIKPRLHEDD